MQHSVQDRSQTCSRMSAFDSGCIYFSQTAHSSCSDIRSKRHVGFTRSMSGSPCRERQGGGDWDDLGSADEKNVTKVTRDIYDSADEGTGKRKTVVLLG